MRIVTVDDHPLTRQGLAGLLRATFHGCEVWGTSRNDEVVSLSSRVAPDLVLLDLHLPDPPSTAQTCRRLRESGLVAPIVVLTAYEDDQQIQECLAAGADGCLLKDASTASIAAALRRALTGEQVLDPRVQEALARRMVSTLRQDGPALTAREREILLLLAEGRSNRQLAEELYVAESTVKWHVRRLMAKLDASTRWQAVVHARRRGLL